MRITSGLYPLQVIKENGVCGWKNNVKIRNQGM